MIFFIGILQDGAAFPGGLFFFDLDTTYEVPAILYLNKTPTRNLIGCFSHVKIKSQKSKVGALLS